MFGKKDTSLPPIETAVGATRPSGFSLISFLIALVLIAAGAAGYVWNEQRALVRHQAYVEKVGKYNKIDPAAYEPVYEGKPIYFIATTGPGEELKDDELGFSAGKVAALSREVAMFQWVEKEVKDSATGELTYDYEKAFDERYFNSAKFAVLSGDYRNPSPMLDDKFIETQSPVFGAYRVAPEVLKKIMVTVPMPAEIVSRFPAAWQPRVTAGPESISIRPTGEAIRQTFELGDLVVSYKALPVGTRVLVAGIQQGAFVNPIEHFEVTQVESLDELLQKPVRGFEQDIWIARGGAAAALAIGFVFLFGTARRILGGAGATIGAVFSFVLACAQISKYYWVALADVVHILNIVSAISGGLLVASIFIFTLRTVRKRMAAHKVQPPQQAAPPPLPPSFNLDIPPASPPSNPV